MKVYTLEREQFISQPIDRVFSFFNRPENLEEITPATTGFHILTPRPIQMNRGAVIDYTIRIMGAPVRWTSIISEYSPPYKFVDAQLKGPYSFWHHTHTFQERGNGTLMKDIVRYAIPMGFIGQLAHVLFVKKQLAHIFDFRKEQIEQYFNSQSEVPHGQNSDTKSNV